MKKFNKCFLVLLVPFIVLTIGTIFNGWYIVGIGLIILLLDSIIGFNFRSYNKATIHNTETIYTNKVPSNKLYFFFGKLFVNKEVYTTNELNHKLIHKMQGQETGYFLMYFLYTIEYIVKFFMICLSKKYINDDYVNVYVKTFRSISFEQEANIGSKIKNYKQNRDSYYWIKYLFKVIN